MLMAKASVIAFSSRFYISASSSSMTTQTSWPLRDPGSHEDSGAFNSSFKNK